MGHVEIEDRCGETEAIDQVKRTANSREHVSRIFHLETALEHRLGEITDDRRQGDDDRKNENVSGVEESQFRLEREVDQGTCQVCS